MFSGSRDDDVTGQVPAANTSGAVSCGGGGGDWTPSACRMSNESTPGPFNASYTELLEDPPGLDYVTAVASNYTLAQTVVLGLLAGSTSFVTISGNLVVILSFILERSIRQPSNYFIASLAVSDLLIGSISMPFYTVYLLSGKYWPLGPTLCDLWLSLDYTVCLCSIYTVFCITIDRFCSVRIPAKYRNWRTERKVLTVISVTWVVPTLVFFTSIIGWQYFVGKRTVPDGMCYVQYMEVAIFNFLLQFGYFWITLTVMCSLYAGIYRVALRLQRQAEAKHQRRAAMLVSAAGSAMPNMGVGGDPPQEHQAAGTTLATTVAESAPVDQHNAPPAQQLNGNKTATTATAGSNQLRAVTGNNVAQQPDTCISPPKADKKKDRYRRRHHGKQSKKRHQSDDNDDQSSSFAFTSDSDQGDADSSRHAVGRTSASTATGQQVSKAASSSSSRTSKKHRRRVTRHPSPVVAIERAVQFIAEQRKTTDDDVYRPETETPTSMRNVSGDCTSQQPCVLASADQSRAFAGGCRSTPEASMSRCHLDHQCVFEAWRRPLPNLSPVWVRRQRAGRCRQRLDCDNNGRVDLVRSTSDTHIVVVDEQDRRTRCGGCKHISATLADVNCLSPRRSPDAVDSCRRPGVSAEGETVAARRLSQRRRSSAARRSVTEQRRKPFAFVRALRRLSHTRRWRRDADTAAPGGASTTTEPRTSKNENRARKALRTITIILGAFVLCWTPWHVLSMIMGFCFPCVEPVIYDISYWLCYLNSPINPFCYAFANQQFKKTFLRIFRGDWHRT